MVEVEGIPGELKLCLDSLDSQFSQSDKELLRGKEETELWQFHFSTGMWIRNTFGLWNAASPLVKFLETVPGLVDADSMSTFIIITYWRYLNGKPFDLNVYINQGL